MTGEGPNLVEYSLEGTVLAFRVEPAVMASLRSACDGLGVRLWEAEGPTDLIAVPNFLAVCDFSRVPAAQLRAIYDCLLAVDDSTLLFTAPPALAVPEGLKKRVIKAPALVDEDSLRLLVMRRKKAVGRHHKTARSYDRKLFRLFFILREIRAQGFVYSRDFCSEFGVTQRTVARDIELLITIGEPIEYDAARKGYRLLGGLDTSADR